MNYHSIDKDYPESGIDQLHDNVYCDLLNLRYDVFEKQKGAARVLGENHPVVMLMKGAVESLDPEELEVALAAYGALPEHIQHRIRHPWVGHPPPPGTRERLLKEHVSEVAGEESDHDPVGCYLQVDAREVRQGESDRSADGYGQRIEPAIVYDLRTHDKWPVRIRIAEGSDKEETLGLLTAVFIMVDPAGGSRSERTSPPRLRA